MSNKSVLIVEDDTSIRTMVRSVLKRDGFDVDEVESDDEAIARIAEKTYDAVVLDVTMSSGNGHDVLRTLAENRPHEKCVVVISGSSPKALEEVDHGNVEAKLRKPFDIHDLLEAVRRCARLLGR